MRFDDRLATVLARAPDRASARTVQWRQLLDLLAQHRLDGPPERHVEALTRFAGLRHEVPVLARRDAVAAIAARPVPIELVALLAADAPPVAGALLSRVVLDETAWLALLPRLGPTGRAFLRHRRDLGPRVVDGLAAFGGVDLVLGGTVAGIEPLAEPEAGETGDAPSAAPIAGRGDPGGDSMDGCDDGLTREASAEARILPFTAAVEASDEQRELPLVREDDAPFRPDAGHGQIRSIISRIARFRGGEADSEDAAPADAPLTRFAFETDRDGTIRHADVPQRGALIGETIARHGNDAAGADAAAADAFARRAPFRDARLIVSGEGGAAGEWRIAGVPVFATGDGRFMGYRGIARRPAAAGETDASTPVAPAQRGDTLRQVVHELRTPLNAIGGFAEMIRRQMRGPVAGPYRARAGEIAAQAGRLMSAVEDLDVAARLAGRRMDLQRLPVSPGPLLAPLAAAEAEAARTRGLAFEAIVPAELPPVLGDGAAIARMTGHLLGAATAAATAEETVTLAAEARADAVVLRIARPARLAGVPEEALFDPDHEIAGDVGHAPLLGIGFSLHLARRLAAAAGVRLIVEAGAFALHLPLAEPPREADAG